MPGWSMSTPSGPIGWKSAIPWLRSVRSRSTSSRVVSLTTCSFQPSHDSLNQSLTGSPGTA